jgi:hypothetical protein
VLNTSVCRPISKFWVIPKPTLIGALPSMLTNALPGEATMVTARSALGTDERIGRTLARIAGSLNDDTTATGDAVGEAVGRRRMEAV